MTFVKRLLRSAPLRTVLKVASEVTGSSTTAGAMPVAAQSARDSTVQASEMAGGRPIAVLGYDASTPEVLRAAVALGFKPVAVYAPNGTVAAGSKIRLTRAEVEAMGVTPGLGFEGAIEIDVLGDEEFRGLLTAEEIPLVIGSYGLRERDYFIENLLFARNHLKYRGRILHPSYLGDFHCNPNRRHAIIGFPGSGNMIFQNVCSRLVPASSTPVWAKDPLSAAVSQFALSHWYSLNGVLAGAFNDAGRWQDVAGPSHVRFGAIYMGLADQISPVVVAGLPQRSYIWSNPWHTSHEPLTASTIKFFAAQNFHTIQILRHPLDLVVSNAAKITVSAGDRAPQVLLQNDAWMDSMLAVVEAYYKCIVDNKDAASVSLLRYEELLASPISVIRKLAEILEVKCDDSQAEAIWTALEGKPLSGPGHLWDPRAGKWRDFIPPRFAERIFNSPLREYAEAVGYELPVEAFAGGHCELPPDNKCSPLDIAWQDARWETSTGKRHAVMHPDLYRVHDQESGLLMICGREFEAPMERLRRSPIFADLLAAGRLEAWPDAPLIAEYIGLR